MLKSISNLGAVLNKTVKQSINGGRSTSIDDVDCISHTFFCNDAHPDSYPAFRECMDSCGCE